MTEPTPARPAASSELHEHIPEVFGAFQKVHRAATADGEVPRRIKEAAALAISVVKRCDGCIDHHARAAARAGATPGEIAEMLGLALLMDGGPATVYGPRAFDTYNAAVAAASS